MKIQCERKHYCILFCFHMDTDKEEPRSNLTGPELPLYVKPLPTDAPINPNDNPSRQLLPSLSYRGEDEPQNLSGIAKASHLE